MFVGRSVNLECPRMSLFFYMMVSLISFHCILMLWGLIRIGKGKKFFYSISIALSMLIMVILSVINDMHWEILSASYAAFRLLIVLETLVTSWRAERTPAVVPVDLLMVGGAMAAFASQLWWIFCVSYFLHWALTYILVQNQMSNS